MNSASFDSSSSDINNNSSKENNIPQILSSSIKDLINSARNNNSSSSTITINDSSITNNSEKTPTNSAKLSESNQGNYDKPDINKILLSDSTLLNVNINYNSNNNINKENRGEYKNRNNNNIKPVDAVDNDYLLNNYAANIIKRIPQPFNELRNNYKNSSNKNTPCPILINQPWTEYKSGDSDPEGYNIS